MRKIIRIAIIATCLASLYGCAADARHNLYGTLWMQSSSEYKACCLQTYHVAKATIDLSLNDRRWTAVPEQAGNFSSLPAAVIMDVDETVLDNSKYQARLLIDGAQWNPDTWDEWVALKDASAVPGAVDFIRMSRAKGIRVIFITNRTCEPRKDGGAACPQEQDTIDNLGKVGIDGVRPEEILLRNERPGWSSEKKSRRDFVTARYRVLMEFGDNLGDFLPDVNRGITPAQRDERMLRYESYWGRKWYMLSNPVYGSWLKVLEKPESKNLVGY